MLTDFDLDEFYPKSNDSSSEIELKSVNKIFYGAPGTGKSHRVREIVRGKDERTERVTFHPEYDYASFVGGYKPTMDEDNIRYEFVPQAFTNIYVKAWNDLENDYYLVIEEINRGNCAEIFGDIFQLLDRTNDYEITPSKELKEYLTLKLNNNPNIDAEKLLLPPNLNILATMNTSDQSLFPMDSAFKRRWDWEYIPINYERSETNGSSKFKVIISENESFSWLSFIQAVNTLIKTNDNLGMDKCLGNYFIKTQSGSIELETFINKAVFYLWNDVFKDEIEENNIFKDKTTYEDFFPINPNGIKKVKEILEILQVSVNESKK
ncbi:MAG: AAA family ATPase [Oceanicaulis sp.]|nr:AAA family ATPase [Oceanicaulis sp.]